MKKNFIALMLVFMLVFAMFVPSFADDTAEREYTFVVDNYESIEADNQKELNDLANQIYKSYGVAIFYVVTANTGNINGDRYAENYFYENSPCNDGFVLVDNTGNDFGRHVFAAGRCKSLFGTRWDAMDHNYLLEPTFYKGAKVFYNDCMSVLKAIDINTVQETASTTQADTRLFDQAKLLSDKDAEKLLANLDKVSDEMNTDIIILTAESLSESSPTAYAKKYFNQNGFGRNDSKDGVVLLYVGDTKEQWLYTFGNAASVYSDDGIEYIANEISQMLEKGKYKDAFNRFVELCGNFEEKAATGEAFTADTLPEATVKPPKTPTSSSGFSLDGSLIWIIVAALLGAGVIIVIISNMRKQKLVIYDETETNYYDDDEEEDIDF